MGMRVENTTNYRTDDLRKFLWALIVEAGLDPRQEWRIKVELVHNRHYWDCVKGYAYRNSNIFCLKIPAGWGGIGSDPGKLISLARVVHHEIDHCRGLSHGEMVDCKDIETTAWEGHCIRFKDEKKRLTTEDRVAKRRAHAERMARDWSKKLQTAKRCLKKWKRKVRYYERRAEKKVAGENEGGFR